MYNKGEINMETINNIKLKFSYASFQQLNDLIQEYISDETVIKRANAAVKIELEKNRALGVPTVLYDRKSQVIYRENDDGTKTEVGRRIRKGRYSERTSKES